MPLLLVACTMLAQPKVCGIAIFENEHVSDWRIKRLIRTREAPWYHKIIGRKSPFRARQLERDLKIIENYYRAEGFLDVKVRANAHLDGDEDCAYINIFIEEGERFILDGMSFEGYIPDHVSEGELRARLESEAGEPVNPNLLHMDARRIRRLMQERGYPYATAAMELERLPDYTAQALFRLDFGKFAHFGQTSVSGLVLTKESVVERELKIEEGAPFDISKITSSRQELFGTGLFSAVVIEPVNFDFHPDTIDYNVTIVERAPQWTTLSLGAGSEGDYDFVWQAAGSWGHRNLFGTGRELALELSSDWKLNTEGENIREVLSQWSNLNNRIELKYTEPYIFRRKIPFTINPYYEPGNSVKIPQYTIQLIGVNLSGIYRPNPHLTHLGYVVFEIADIYDIRDPEVREDIFTREGQFFTRSVGWTTISDHRDNLLVPTEGSYTYAQAEMAGYFLGGDKHYTKLVLDFRRYFSIRESFVLGMRAKSSVLGNWRKGEHVLIHDRFFLGGANSVRGWKERSIGPVSSSGAPLGGKLSLLGNIECRMPLIWQIWGHTFFDVGNVWTHAEAFEISDLHGSAGWGLAVITPVGPVRFDYGYQIINRSETPPKSSWHLSLMYSF